MHLLLITKSDAGVLGGADFHTRSQKLRALEEATEPFCRKILQALLGSCMSFPGIYWPGLRHIPHVTATEI